MAFNGHKKWTSEEDELLQTMVSQGKAYKQIAAALGRTTKAIGERVYANRTKTAMTTEQAEPSFADITVQEEPKAILDVAKETACRLGFHCVSRIEYRNSETQESATVRAIDNSGNAISVVIIKNSKEGAK